MIPSRVGKSTAIAAGKKKDSIITVFSATVTRLGVEARDGRTGRGERPQKGRSHVCIAVEFLRRIGIQPREPEKLLSRPMTWLS